MNKPHTYIEREHRDGVCVCGENRSNYIHTAYLLGHTNTKTAYPESGNRPDTLDFNAIYDLGDEDLALTGSIVTQMTKEVHKQLEQYLQKMCDVLQMTPPQLAEHFILEHHMVTPSATWTDMFESGQIFMRVVSDYRLVPRKKEEADEPTDVRPVQPDS